MTLAIEVCRSFIAEMSRASAATATTAIAIIVESSLSFIYARIRFDDCGGVVIKRARENGGGSEREGVRRDCCRVGVAARIKESRRKSQVTCWAVT